MFVDLGNSALLAPPQDPWLSVPRLPQVWLFNGRWFYANFRTASIGRNTHSNSVGNRQESLRKTVDLVTDRCVSGLAHSGTDSAAMVSGFCGVLIGLLALHFAMDAYRVMFGAGMAGGIGCQTVRGAVLAREAAGGAVGGRGVGDGAILSL